MSTDSATRSTLNAAHRWFAFLTSTPVLVVAFVVAFGMGAIPFEMVHLAVLVAIFAEVWD